MSLMNVAAPAGPTGESMCKASVGVRARFIGQVEDGPAVAAGQRAIAIAAAGKESA